MYQAVFNVLDLSIYPPLFTHHYLPTTIYPPLFSHHYLPTTIYPPLFTHHYSFPHPFNLLIFAFIKFPKQ